MIVQSPYTVTVSQSFSEGELNKGTWLVILNASRTPPHVGLMIDGNYNSLTIKGHELNIQSSVLVKTIRQKKIESLFIRLKHHPVFSMEFQKEICQYYIKQFNQVKANEASCLSPIKLFLQEFYAVLENKNELLFELIERLKQNQYISCTFGINVEQKLEEQEFSLPMYSNDELQKIIKSERSIYYKE
jgi:cell division protein FtsB